MAQHLLDEADVDSVLQHDRRHRVPKEMARTSLTDVCGVHVVAHHLRQAVRVEGVAGIREEEDAVVGFEHEAGTHLSDVLVDPGDRAIAGRDHAIFLALALAHHDRAALHVEVALVPRRE